MRRRTDRPLNVWPLQRMDETTEPGQWTEYHPGGEGEDEYWLVTRDVRLHLPGVPLLTCVCDYWQTEHGIIAIRKGWAFDGASGPAIDDPSALMAAAVHDVVCTRLEGPGNEATHPLPSYWARHALYARILRAQGEPGIRCAWSWLGLVAGNWVVELRQWK